MSVTSGIADTAPSASRPTRQSSAASPTAARSRRLLASRIAAIVSIVAFLVLAAVTVWIDVTVATTPPPFDPAGIGAPQVVVDVGWTTTLCGFALMVPGVLLLWRLSWHPIALLLTGFGLYWALDGLAVAWGGYALALDQSAPLADLAYWFFARMGSGLLLFVPLLLVLFPTGRLLGGIWRPISIASIVFTSFILVGGLFADFTAIYPTEPDPAAMFDPNWLTISLPAQWWSVYFVVAQAGPIIGVALALAVAIARYVKSDAAGRSQLRWLIWSAAVAAVLLVFSRAFPPEWVIWLLVASLSLVATAVMVAVLRYRLYSIDRVLSWSLVYGVLLVGVLLVDVALVALVGAFVDSRTTALAAVLVVTLVYAPLRERLFRLASRVVNGRRDDPYGVVSALAARLEESTDSLEQLREMVSAIADAYVSPYVRVELDNEDGGRLVASHGQRRSNTTTIHLEYRGAPIGRLVMAPGRRPRLSDRDQQLLLDLVRQSAAAIRATELNRQLQRIREELVSTREEERHRLRRDLHDGLGPLLASIRLRIDTARNLAARDPHKADAVIESAISDATEAVADISRLVQDLRPPALDDLGLERAVAQQCDRFRSPERRVDFEARISGELSAAVEVAAYRIVSEALGNMAKHSRATHVRVSLATTPDLVIEVSDDGVGIPANAVAGIGLASQRERALELGGEWSVTSRDGGGTTVRASLPAIDLKELSNA